MEKEYLKKIDEYRDEMLETLRELVAIPSVAGEPAPHAPFGINVKKAFEFMLEKGKEAGFEIENIDDYGGHMEFGGYLYDEEGYLVGTSDETMGILCHLDVVPEGKDWDYDPFGGQIEEDKMFGRGTIDDKGPTIAAFYAMKALKDAGVIPEKKVRLILGLDEETGWKGMDYYLKRVKAPDFSFTPDGEFPAIHGEKGILVFDLAKKISKTSANAKGISLRSMSGGNAANMVADYARVVIKANAYDDIKNQVATFKKETGYQLSAKGVGKNLELTSVGISSHGARPEHGLNAISVMMQFLEQINWDNEDVRDFIDFYNKHIGFELDGTSLGCALEDAPSGKLILNVGMVKIDQESASLTINIRYPVTGNDEQVYEAMLPDIHKFNLGIVKKNHQMPIYMPKDDPMIKTLMAVYREHTGDTEAEPLVIGGGTYARAVKNAVAFGANFPGEPELAHQKNEYISISNLITCCKIYADAICMLADGKIRKEKENI